MHSPDRWLAQTLMTAFDARLPSGRTLPPGVADLNRVVNGLLVHCAWLGHYDADPSVFGPVSRTTLPVQQRLTSLLERDGRGLVETRCPAQREVGTCRDFALMLCAFLREAGTPARVRCGFASYFRDAWEDHWVCEYWNSRDGRWCLSDAQIDVVLRAACGITFDTADVPRDVFLTAGEAWLRCRAGDDDPARYGNGDTNGLWLIGVNLVRDALVVNNRETSSWDRWREAPLALRSIPPDRIAAFDHLARNPEEVVDWTPPWLEGIA